MGMEKGICYIIGAGFGFDFSIKPNKEDYCIAADGGYCKAYENNFPVDLVVGDFDSLKFIPDFSNIDILPKEKDDTDSLYAVKKGLQMGYNRFVIMGGSGGRLSHTIANIQTLKFIYDNGGTGTIIGEKENITLLKDGILSFDTDKKGKISVFSYNGKALSVTLKGLKYPLNNYEMTDFFPIGVSNEFLGVSSEVIVEKGLLIIIYDR